MPISEALLDQAVVAGVGNIAKSEILFQTRLDPRIPANEVTGTMDRLLDSIRRVLWKSYDAGAAGCAECITGTASGVRFAAA